MKILSLACVVFAACAAGPLVLAPDPFAPPNAREVAPDSMWVRQYHEAEKCSGLVGDVSRIRWYLVPGNYFIDTEGNKDDAIWTPQRRIYIAEGWKNAEWIARHESLHDLRHDGQHPVDLFGEQCHAIIGYLQSDDPTYRP